MKIKVQNLDLVEEKKSVHLPFIFAKPRKTKNFVNVPDIIKVKRQKAPPIEKWWTTIYYGVRGSGKTLHQAKMVVWILNYLDWLYYKNPELNQSIIFSVQRFSKKIEDKYLGWRLFYWTDAKDLRYCPRKECWKGKSKHRLHGCYLIFDDIATILPADNWNNTPIWLRKTFAQGRHFGVRILANLQDPFSCDINFRRYTDMAFRFRKVMGSPDPDETKKPVKRIWGFYHMRKIRAELLWKWGDMSNEEIVMQKEKNKQMAQVTGKNLFSDVWKGSVHRITREICEIYDTTQDVPEYKPTGYEHTELYCTDPKHNHTDKKAENYCGFKKVTHELV